VAKFGWWFGAAVLPVVIWPALDWSQALALAMTDYWFQRTGDMPSWSQTATVAAICAFVLAVASGLLLFFALRIMMKFGAPGRIGWLAAGVSLAIIAGAVLTLGERATAVATLSRVAPGVAMAAGAVAAQLLRRPKAASVARPAAT
jgi:hypothetical protein